MTTNVLRADQRAVAGMPIRLVVAVTIGAAAVGLLFPMLETIEAEEETAVTVEVVPQQVVLESGSPERVSIKVITESGKPVDDVTILISGRSLPVEGGPVRFETGPDSNTVGIEIGKTTGVDVPVDFRPTQRRGTLMIDVIPPSGTKYTDVRANPEITVRKR